MISRSFPYQCIERKQCTQDISILTLLPTTSHKISFVSGQYIEVLLPNGIWLPLSIGNAPREDSSLEFHLRHYNKGDLAQVLLDALEYKSTLELRGPKGDSVFNSVTEPKIIFVAGGTGFAPIGAILESLLENTHHTLFLYWGIRRPEDAYQMKKLIKWDQIFPHFHYQLVLSEPENFPSWKGPTGLVHEFVAQHNQQDFNDCTVFASGPFGMIKASYELFMDCGLDEKQFISDIKLAKEPIAND